MPVVLARVDDRLIHGQIVEGWVPFVGADAIYVVDDEICLDESRCRLMRMILPSGLGLRIISTPELCEALSSDRLSRVLILFNSLNSLVAAIKNGFSMENINVGNIHNLRGGHQITPTVFLNKDDITLVKKLHDMGIVLEVRDVPDGRCHDLFKLVCHEDVHR